VKMTRFWQAIRGEKSGPPHIFGFVPALRQLSGLLHMLERSNGPVGQQQQCKSVCNKPQLETHSGSAEMISSKKHALHVMADT
jgi:hypothetical protein